MIIRKKIGFVLFCLCFSTFCTAQIIWKYPDADELGAGDFKVENNEITVKIFVAGILEKDIGQLEFYLNDKKISDKGKKMDNTRLLGQTVTKMLQVPEGKSTLFVKWGKSKSKTISLVKGGSGSKPKLHILAFGVTGKKKEEEEIKNDLKYTIKDAHDFTNAFRGQTVADGMFSDIKITNISGEEATSQKIREIIELESTYAKDRRTLDENDFFILYLSSHGYFTGTNLYILGSDFVNVSPSTTSVSYAEIIRLLEIMPCKKIILTDACQSPWNVVTDDAEIMTASLEELFRDKTDFAVLTSSSIGQYSWEVSELNNGAFTSIILRGLSGKADANGDNIIHTDELFDFTIEQVPPLVQSYRSQIQVPSLVVNNLGNPKFYLPEFYGKNTVELPIEEIIQKPEKIISEPVMIDIKPVRNADLVNIPAGSFERGTEDADLDEQPVRTIKIDNLIADKYEVTFEMFDAFTAATGRKKAWDNDRGRGKNPVINVSWYEAIRFCNWRSLQERLVPAYYLKGKYVKVDPDANGYRLPTEAEWEYLAKAGKNTLYSGDTKIENVAWYSANANRNIQLVGQKLPNAFGLYDMTGNVAEWCFDLYGENYYEKSDIDNPQGPKRGEDRIVRGGSWDDIPRHCTVTRRVVMAEKEERETVGFRCVRWVE